MKLDAIHKARKVEAHISEIQFLLRRLAKLCEEDITHDGIFTSTTPIPREQRRLPVIEIGKIRLIKRIRSNTGFGLKEAKDTSEDLQVYTPTQVDPADGAIPSNKYISNAVWWTDPVYVQNDPRYSHIQQIVNKTIKRMIELKHRIKELSFTHTIPDIYEIVPFKN